MAAICLKTQPQRLMPVLFLLNLVYASQTTIVTLAEFLATACNALNDATVVPVLCSFSPGNWSISQPPPAVLLRNPKTTITGSVVEPRRVGTADTTEYGTWLNLPATIPEPLLNIPPNSTLTLANLKITGALLQLQLQPGLPNPGAITLGPGAQLQLLNVHVSTSCKSLAAYQVFVCQQQQLPSPNFNVDYGTLTYLSYTTPALELVNVTITCGSADEPVPEPDCLSVVAAAGADVLAVVGRRRPEAPFPDQSMPIFVHITRNFTLMPPAAAAAAAPVTAPSTGLSATVEVEENAEAEVALSPPPVTSVLLTQDLLFISGSSDIPTWLDLSGSESLIRLADNARVVLQDLTLVGLPMGPARAYPLGLLRIPVWTFDFQRIAVGTTKKRLTLRNLRLALTPAEVAALAHDLQGPGVPAPASDPWVPFCACNLVIFGDVDLGLATAPQPAGTAADQSPAAAAPPVPVPVVGLSLFLRKASTAFGSMLYMENVLLDASAMSSEAGVFDWRQEPLCQLLPFNQALDEPPQFPIDVKGTVLKLQGPFIFPISMNSDRNKPYFILTEDSALLVGPPPPEGTITFSQLQAYIIGVSVLLGDPVRPRLLNTYQMPAAVNLRQPSASLTLRSLILTNLSVAGVHPLSTASTASRLVRLHSRGLRQHSYSSSSSSSSSPPWPPPPPSRSIQAPAGRDPTGGLPRGLANFTSCLWILDFDRNVSGGGGGGDSGGDSSGAALLDSVVIVVPHPEFALLRWLLSHNDTAPVTDAAVAEQLRDMLNRSILATRGGGGGVGASYGSGGGVDSADGTDGVSLTFKTLHWCGLAGRNVTVKSVGSSDTPPGKGLWAPLGLGLPVSYPFSALGSLPAGAAEPSLPPPPPLWRNGSSSLMDADAGSSGDSWVIYVAVICGVAAGLLVALLLCIMVVCIVRRHRRRRRLLEHVNELNVPSPPPSMIADIACAADNNGTAPCSLRTPTTHRRDTAVNVCDPAAGSALPAPPDSKTTSDGKLPFAGAASAPPVLVAQGPAEEPRLSPTATMAAAAALRPLSSAAIGGGGGGGGGESLGTWCDMTISGLGQLLANREFSDTSLSQGTVPDGGGDGGGPAAAALGAQTTAALTSPNVTTHSTSGTVSPTPRAQPAVPSAVLSTTVPSGDSSSMVEAATVNHQKREVLLLRQIALSLHTRMIRTREAVADGRGHASAISDTETPLGPMGQCDSTVAPDAAPSAPRTVDCPAVLDPAATLRDGDASADLGGGGNPAAAAVATDSGVLILTGELGRGAQGVVYSGRWRGINVAVKSLLLHLPVRGPSASEAANSASGSLESPILLELAQQRALREAAIGVAASQHPNVVATYHVDVGVLGQELSPFATATATAATATATATAAACWKVTMISQLCEGGSLRSALSSGLLARCSANVSASGMATTSLSGLPSSESTTTTTTTTTAAAAAPTGTSLGALNKKALAAPRGPDAVATSAPAAAAAATSDEDPPGLMANTAMAMVAAATSGPGQPPPPLDQQQLQQQQQQQLPPQQQLLQPRVLLFVALDVALGIMQLHGMNVVHGDVSSSNVLLASRTRAAAAADIASSSSSSAQCSGDPRKQKKTSAASHAGGGIDDVTTESGWLSNSSDALALLVDLTCERGRAVRYMQYEDSNGGDTLAATAAAQGLYSYVAKLCDFGLAEVVPQGQQYVSTPCRRSSAYTGPELALYGRLYPASDVYAWGIVCWELALGLPLPAALAAPSGAAVRAWLAAADMVAPPVAPTAAKQHWQQESALPPALLAWPPHVPHALVVLVGECLGADPAGRPTARDVVRRLEHIISSL